MSLSWTQTLVYLLLRDKGRALTVRGVVGEVVCEGFDSVSHGLARDTLKALWETDKFRRMND